MGAFTFGGCMASAFESTRRAALAALGALAMICGTAGHGAVAQERLAFRDIRVDVSPLRANAGDPTAAWVQQELPARLAHALAGRMSASGRTLIVRIVYLTLGSNTGDAIHSNSSWDNIRGVAIIGDAHIPVEATSSYMSSPVDWTMIEQSNH